MARQLRLQCALLMPPNVTLKRCTTLNPATLLPALQDSERGEEGSPPDSLFLHSLSDEELFELEHEHDCLSLIQQETCGFAHVTDKELFNPDVEFFVDGSRSVGEDGRFYTGYAVVSGAHEVVKAEPLPPHRSAQEAELMALKEALQLAEGVPVPGGPSVIRREGSVEESWGPDASRWDLDTGREGVPAKIPVPSRWPEASPMTKATARAAAKKLVSEIFSAGLDFQRP
ncbi:uncharacterized protein [Engystomops pustulosus]|uniref:uncharacterized protein isoform X3 n=1 Tax=Engystomops pustulosus TaxID=76066 RepID=UPI003AFB638C